MATDPALLRLLQLVSPSLPIGMYSYSQGLERAVEDQWISNEREAGEWISGLMIAGLCRVDIPILARLYDAWTINDFDKVRHWSRILLACRETAELRAEDRQTGQALARLLDGLNIHDIKPWIHSPETTFAALFSFAAATWSVPKQETLTGYLWSWLENQVLCAVKLVPLGQVAGQRLLGDLAGRIPAVIDEALNLADDDIGGSAFGLALASSRHEMQYCRLFRS
jgi:urease accessory protein